jgi:hypothetical protein
MDWALDPAPIDELAHLERREGVRAAALRGEEAVFEVIDHQALASGLEALHPSDRDVRRTTDRMTRHFLSSRDSTIGPLMRGA